MTDESILGTAAKRLEEHKKGRKLMDLAENETFEKGVIPELDRIKKDFLENQIPQIFFPLLMSVQSIFVNKRVFPW